MQIKHYFVNFNNPEMQEPENTKNKYQSYHFVYRSLSVNTQDFRDLGLTAHRTAYAIPGPWASKTQMSSLTFTLYIPYKKVRLRTKVSFIAPGVEDENLMKLRKVSCLRIIVDLQSFIVKAFRFLLEFIRVAL